MADRPLQPGRTKAEMPRIPGVPEENGKPAAQDPFLTPAPASTGHSANYHAASYREQEKPAEKSAGAGFSMGSLASLRAPALLAAALLAGGLGWWALHASHRRPVAPLASDITTEVPPADLAPAAPQIALPAPRLTASGATIVAKVGELDKPWSSKKFLFADAVKNENVAAMIVRLPSGAASNRASYWAFSLTAPFKNCDLDFITDTAQISARFAYHATHPMAVSACDASVYDPLRVSTVAAGAWVRGEVVAGTGIRPPMSVDIAVQGDTIVADGME